MSRRLKDAVEALTAELVMFRKSSDGAAGKLARLTWVIIVLTVAVVGLTAAVGGLPGRLANSTGRACR